MQFQLSEEHAMIRKAARDFAHQECLPGVIERDENQKFPKEQIEKLASLGFMGMMVDPANGGAGMDTISYVIAMEEISKIDASVSVCMSVNNSLVCWGLEKYGDEKQKKKYLTSLAQGKKEEALKMFELNGKRFPGVWPVNFGLARGYSANGRYAEALKYAKLALAQAPDEGNKKNIEAAIKKLEAGQDMNT